MVLLGYPRPSNAAHLCSVGIDLDPPMCLDAQSDIIAKRQHFCGMWSWTWSEKCVVVNILSDVGTENTDMIINSAIN